MYDGFAAVKLTHSDSISHVRVQQEPPWPVFPIMLEQRSGYELNAPGMYSRRRWRIQLPRSRLLDNLWERNSNCCDSLTLEAVARF